MLKREAAAAAMCGIWFCLGPVNPRFCDVRPFIKTLRARGPESIRIAEISGVVGLAAFTRLAINGLDGESGMQPMVRGPTVWMCNGEIYNWRALAEQYDIPVEPGSSDCQVLGALYERLGTGPAGPAPFFRALDGVFAMVIIDRARGIVVAGRDPYGVRPLFVGQRMSTVLSPNDTSGPVWKSYPYNMIWASELKAMTPLCEIVAPFPPGHYQVVPMSLNATLPTAAYIPIRYHDIPVLKSPACEELEIACLSVRRALEAAVKKRMMTERPVAALLSGGIDSSLIASLAARELRAAGAPPLRTFSVGMPGSTDLAYAQKVAAWIGSDHTEIVLSPDDFFRAIPEVIHAIETYDTTTVRASVGNWLVAKAVRERSDCKVVFNGDGSDEVFGSYLYFYNAPGPVEFEEEVTRLLTDIHMFDVLRSDRTISCHGLEPRTPFLDKQFVSAARSVPTRWRQPGVLYPEKWVLRRAFDDGVTLPRDVLWRRKEAFSDGVSSAEAGLSWYQIVQQRVKELVPANWEELAEKNYSWMTPRTAEQYYYRYTFEAHFGKGMATVNVPYFWMPQWSPGATDPSARTLAVYGADQEHESEADN